MCHTRLIALDLCESSILNLLLLLKMCLVSIIRIFVYILDISRETNLYVGSIGVSFKACINSLVFFMLNVCGRDVSWLIFFL